MANKTDKTQLQAYEDSLQLRKALQELFTDSFVIERLEYRRLILDFAIIVKDRLIEVAHVTTQAEFLLEFDKLGRIKKNSFKKHVVFMKGEFISNAFYFMAPSRLLPVDTIPEKYGLITYKDDLTITIKKEAEYVERDYLTRDNYKTLAKKLTLKLYEDQQNKIRL